MLRSKTLLLFLLKAVLIYGFLSLPISAYDEAYGEFYRKVAGIFSCHFAYLTGTGLTCIMATKTDRPGCRFDACAVVNFIQTMDRLIVEL